MTQRWKLPEVPASAAQLREHVKRTPDDGNAWLALAQLLARSGSSAELYHALEQAIKSLPERDESWLLAAEVHHRERGPGAALQWLENAARQNPGLSAPKRAATALRSRARARSAWARGDAARAAGRWQEALDAYREAGRHEDEGPGLLINIGSCQASLDRHDEAAECFRRALRLDPGSAEARLNLALLEAYRGDYEAAEASVEAVLTQTRMDDASREQAQTLLALLREHARLNPYLDEAVRSGDVARLEEAIRAAPSSLSQPSEAFVARLRSLAESCAALEIDDTAFRYSSDTSGLPLVEACFQVGMPNDAEAIAELAGRLRREKDEAGKDDQFRRIRHFLGLIAARAKHPASPLQRADGEAWLRYWHARLLADQPEKLPGQYKLAVNTIYGLRLTPPAHVTGTMQVMLREIVPQVPAGVTRGMFAVPATNLIHAFSDGNGRLGRHLLAWECEAVGLQALTIPTELRSQAGRALETAQFGGDVAPWFEILREAHARTDALLGRLGDTAATDPRDFR